jgi:rod shape-determining protein MreD
MRKTTITLISILILFCSIYIQQNFLNNIPLFGVLSNISIIFIVSIGLICGIVPGVLTGLFYGIITDISIGRAIGIYLTVYILIGLFMGLVSSGFSRDNKLAVIVMVFLITIIGEMTIYVFSALLYKYDFEIIRALLIASMEAVYNCLITVLIYRVVVWLCELINRYKNKYLL